MLKQLFLITYFLINLCSAIDSYDECKIDSDCGVLPKACSKELFPINKKYAENIGKETLKNNSVAMCDEHINITNVDVSKIENVKCIHKRCKIVYRRDDKKLSK